MYVTLSVWRCCNTQTVYVTDFSSNNDWVSACPIHNPRKTGLLKTTSSSFLLTHKCSMESNSCFTQRRPGSPWQPLPGKVLQPVSVQARPPLADVKNYYLCFLVGRAWIRTHTRTAFTSPVWLGCFSVMWGRARTVEEPPAGLIHSNTFLERMFKTSPGWVCTQ